MAQKRMSRCDLDHTAAAHARIRPRRYGRFPIAPSASGELDNAIVQARSKFSQAGPSRAKPDQRQSKKNARFSLDFLRGIGIFNGLRRPLRRVFYFACPVSPASPRARRAAASAGSLACFPCLPRLTAPARRPCHSSEGIMAQILKICKRNVEKTPKRPEFGAYSIRGRSSAASSPDRHSGLSPTTRVKQPNQARIPQWRSDKCRN